MWMRATLPRLDLAQPLDGKSSGRGTSASLGPKLQRVRVRLTQRQLGGFPLWTTSSIAERAAGGARLDLDQRARVKCKAEGRCCLRGEREAARRWDIRTTPPLYPAQRALRQEDKAPRLVGALASRCDLPGTYPSICHGRPDQRPGTRPLRALAHSSTSA